MNDNTIRIQQIMQILEKEDVLLSDVSTRLFNAILLNNKWLEATLDKPEGTDKLESFVSKFCRMQDTFVDKLTPLFLQKLGEISSSAIDNLNKLEKLNIVNNVNNWIEMRLLRNKLVHEYVENTSELLKHLLLAKALHEELHNSYMKVKQILNENQ